MTPQEFVDAIRESVFVSAVKSTMSTLAKPTPTPAKDLVQASEWFLGLPKEQREHVQYAVTLAAHHAVFGFLAVLDGVRVVESTRDKGEFRLVFVKGDTEYPITPNTGDYLHDLLEVPRSGASVDR